MELSVLECNRLQFTQVLFMIKVLSHPGWVVGKVKFRIVANWASFSFLKKISVSSKRFLQFYLTGRELQAVWECPHRVFRATGELLTLLAFMWDGRGS